MEIFHVISFLIFLCDIFLVTFAAASKKPPNVLFIVADDLGWNDVSWQNPSVRTPNLHALYNESVRFRDYYVQPTCSPSRAAFLTGIYPHKIGFSEDMPSGLASGCLDTKLVLLPQMLKQNAYRTHLIGKWHVGFCDWKCTPTYRGFDTFYGLYDGLTDHYTHRHQVPWSKAKVPPEGLDFRDDEELVLDQNGTYSADSFTNRAMRYLKSDEKPWFLYLAYTLPHFPVQAPEKFVTFYRNEPLTEKRKMYLAMVTALDYSIGRIVSTLRERNLMKETILIFTSDNGGELLFGGNNWPLRGQKYGVFEGGTKSHAFVMSPKISAGDYSGLFHAVDWLNTILSAVGFDFSEKILNLNSKIRSDSVDHWSNILENKLSSPRNEIVYNIRNDSAAIRSGNFKLIFGDPDPLTGLYDWYPENFLDESIEDTAEYFGNPEFRNKIWLFDLQKDPNERRNLAEELPLVRDEMLRKLEKYVKEYKPSRIGHFPQIASGDPKFWGDAWHPGWCIAD